MSINETVSLDEKQYLYIINFNGVLDVLGYQYVFNTLRSLIERGNLQGAAKEEEIGTIEQYNQYKTALSEYSKLVIKKTWYAPKTHPAVKKIIDKYMNTEVELRFFFGDIETGRDWLEEFNVIGKVSRSSGILKFPILVMKGDSYGDGIVFEESVLKIMNAETFEVLWVHENYKRPVFDIVKNEKGLYQVYVYGELFSEYETMEGAAHNISFLAGNTMNNFV